MEAQKIQLYSMEVYVDNNKRTYVFTYMLGLNRLKTYLNDLLEVDVCINLGYFEWHTVHQMYEPIKRRM